MKAFLKFSSLVVLLLAFACANESDKVVLNSVFSIKGQIFPKANEKNGLAGVLATIQSRATSKKAYTVFAENTLHGSPESILSSGKYLINLMNEINTIGLILDSRDFSFGLDRLKELSIIAKFPFVSSNLELVDSESNFIKPYIISPDRGFGVLGVVGPYFETKTFKEYIAGIRVLDPLEQCKKYALELKKNGVNKIYLYASGYKLSDKKSLETIKLLSEIPNVEKIFIGSSTNIDPSSPKLAKNISTFFDDELEYGAGYLETIVGDEKAQDKRISPDEDPEQNVLALLTTIRSNVDAEFYATIGPLLSNLDHVDTDSSPLGGFVCEGIRSELNLDAVLINSGAFRVGLKAGELKLKDLFTVLPFDGKVKVIEMTGEQIYEALSYSATFLVDPEKGRGFLQNAGIRYTVKIDTLGPHLDKNQVFVNGKLLDFNKKYRVGVDTYLANGGDGFTQFLNSAQLDPVVHSEITTLSHYLINNSNWELDQGNRASIIREKKP